MMKPILVGLLAAAAVPTAALALQPAPSASAFAAPRGADRVQTRAEVAGQVRDMFARLDGNRDGFLTREESQAGRKAVGNGPRANRDRGPRDGAARFARLDANRDGAISRAEFDAAHAKRQQRIARRDGDGRPDAHARGMRGARRLQGRMFEVADVNRDARVSIQEAIGAAVRRFDMADVNRDGRLTREERLQSRQRRRAERQRG